MNTADLRARLARGEAALIDLGGRAHFRLTGADRVRYLNGQVSNDIRRVSAQTALPACVMNAKGKLNGVVWVTADDDALLLDTDGPLREEMAARLERYIISDDAELADLSDTFRLYHCLGTVPGLVGAASRRFGMEGTDLLLPTGAEPPEGLPILSAETTETFRIEQGIPQWGAELDENTLPAEAGLDATAVDFHKGCYIGQEIVSRIKSVGRVNRQLTGFATEAPLAIGTPLLTAEGKEAGRITSASWSFALEKTVALGYLKRGMEEAQLTAGGQPIAPRPLPLAAA